MGSPSLLYGEISTGLLRHSGQLSQSEAEKVLSLMPGERVLTALRPITRVISPVLLTGVDCLLPTASGAQLRGIGTVVTKASIIGGKILQSSSHGTLQPSAAKRRLTWSHYLGQPGVLELLGRPRYTDIVRTLDEEPSRNNGCLDLSAMNKRVVNKVQTSELLDRRMPLRVPGTRLRWACEFVTPGSGRQAIRFVLLNEAHTTDALRSLSLQVDELEVQPDSIVAFCEDLARHDWLLTVLLRIIEREHSQTTDLDRSATRLAPAVEHLLHLWMPVTPSDPHLQGLWNRLEKSSGLSRQWDTSVQRVRDQLAVRVFSLLSESRRSAD